MKIQASTKWLLVKFLDLVFYGNFWIAAAALLLFWQTEFLLIGRITYSPLALLVFFGALFLYAIHRLVGMEKVKAFQEKGRYKVIRTFRHHILVYAIISFGVSAFYFFQLSYPLQIALLSPAIIALGYVLPILTNKKRLRDLDYLKIFLIALTWAWVTVMLPAFRQHFYFHIPSYLIFLERSLFIFAITIPFDIRDLQVDEHTAVKTLPGTFGIKASKRLAYGALLLIIPLIYLNFQLSVYNLSTFLALIVSIIISWISIAFSDKINHDYYFTGWIDGLMLLQFALVWLFNKV